MYCSACGSPNAPGLSFCNRCGTSLKDRNGSKTDSVSAYLTAIALIGVAGLVLMLGGAIALRNGAQFGEDIVGIFMLMTFVMMGTIEILLCKQLSRVIGTSEKKKSLSPPQQSALPSDLRAAQPRTLPEPIPSVTENTTRTLEYSRAESLR